MHRIPSILAVLGMIFIMSWLWAKGTEPPKFTPTDTQRLRLENAQLRAKLAQRDFQASVQSLMAECRAVRAEQNWPSTVECNPDTLEFYAAAPRVTVVQDPPPLSKPVATLPNPTIKTPPPTTEKGKNK